MSDASIVPVVRYADPQAAAQWLRKAYGFLIYHVAKRPDGGTAYIVVRFGENAVVIAPHGASVFDDQMVQPAEVGDRSTQACYLTVMDLDRHLTRARTAGARVEVEPRDEDGGRFYVSRDLEGHLWAFGHPLAGTKSTLPERPLFQPPLGPPPRGGRVGLVVALLLGLTVGAAAMYFGSDMTPETFVTRAGLSELMSDRTDHQRFKDAQVVLEDALRAKDAASQELVAERLRLQAIKTQLDETAQQLESQRAESGRADSEAQQLRSMIARLSNSMLSATKAAEAAQGQIAEARKLETELQDKLRTKEHDMVELRARVTILEADIEAARVQAVQAAEVVRTAPAAKIDEARPSAAKSAVPASPPNRMEPDAAKDSARMQPAPTAEDARPAPVANTGEATARDAHRITEVGSLPDHHLTQGKRWISVATIDKGSPKGEAQAAPPAAPPATSDDGATSLCARAVRELVFSSYRTSSATQGRVVKRLCDRAHATREPAKCLSLVLTRKVSWGGGTEWKLKSAVDLCARTPSASTTLTCFSRRIADGVKWEAAVVACAAS